MLPLRFDRRSYILNRHLEAGELGIIDRHFVFRYYGFTVFLWTPTRGSGSSSKSGVPCRWRAPPRRSSAPRPQRPRLSSWSNRTYPSRGRAGSAPDRHALARRGGVSASWSRSRAVYPRLGLEVPKCRGEMLPRNSPRRSLFIGTQHCVNIETSAAATHQHRKREATS